MNGILGAAGFLLVLVFVVVFSIYFFIRESTANSEYSKYIINKFEPDNTAPRITELIEYHKSNKKVHYKIEDGNDGK